MKNTITIKDMEVMTYDELMEVLKNHDDEIETEFYCFNYEGEILVGSVWSEFAFTSVLCKRNEIDRVVAQLQAQGYNVNKSKVRFY